MSSNRTDIRVYSVKRDEALANAALKPGHLIELISTGKVQKHATADGHAGMLVALENLMAGKGIDDTYAADETVEYNVASPGEIYYMWISDGDVIVKGSQLVPNGGGELGLVAGGSKRVVAIALEAVSPSGAAARIPVLIV